MDWFQKMRPSVADPVIDRRVTEVAPELDKSARRSLVFDLVTGSRSLKDAVAELETSHREPVLARLTPPPEVEEAVAALEATGNGELASRIGGLEDLYGGEFETRSAPVRRRPQPQPVPQPRPATPQPPMPRTPSGPDAPRPLDAPGSSGEWAPIVRAPRRNSQSEDLPVHLLPPPPVGSSDLPRSPEARRPSEPRPEASPSADLARLERAVERLETRIDGLRVHLGVTSILAAAAVALCLGYALGVGR